MSDETQTDAIDEIHEDPTLAHKIAAEVIGTFVLVFFGCGAAMGTGAAGQLDIVFPKLYPGVDITATALAFGLTVVVMAYAVGRISGGHFNPAVSLGAAVAGRLSWIDFAIYAASQVVGAVVAAASLFGIFKALDGWEAKGHMGQNGWADGYAFWGAFLVETIATMVFLWVILACTDKRAKPTAAFAPLAIGLSLTMIHLVLIPITGTSVNPARSIGPALFAGTDALSQLWLFILAPLLGAAIGGISYKLLFGHDGVSVPGSGFGAPRPKRAAQQQWGQQPQWSQQGAAWGGQQQWGQQPPQQGWDAHAGQQAAPQQWGQPAQPGQYGAQPQQNWGAPAAATPPVAPPPAYPAQPEQPSAPAAPPAPAAPSAEGQPNQPWGAGWDDNDEDGRTQVRPE